MLFLAITDRERGEMFANGLTRWIVFSVILAFGIRWLLGTFRKNSSSTDAQSDAPAPTYKSGPPRFNG